MGKQSDLEEWKNKEREFGDKITDDAKMLEKMTNKQSLLLKKVKERCDAISDITTSLVTSFPHTCYVASTKTN